MEETPEICFIPPVFSRQGIVLASGVGQMRELDDEIDLEYGVDTFCVAIPDLVSRSELTSPEATETQRANIIVDMLDNLAREVEPHVLIVSFQGPLVLQQLQVKRINTWQCKGEVDFDLPGTTTVNLLLERVNSWVVKNAACKVYLCGPDIPGDALYKIRQVLRMFPPSTCFGERSVLYGRNNPHVLTSIAMGVDLLYQPPEGTMLFMPCPDALRPLLPCLVAYDYTFLPPPPPEMARDLARVTDDTHVECMNTHYASQVVPVNSHEEYLQWIRQGKEPPPVSKQQTGAYLQIVATLHDYYTTGKINNGLLYWPPYYPTSVRFSRGQESSNLQNVHVLPSYVQLALIAPKNTTSLPKGVVSLMLQLSPPPAPLPLAELKKAGHVADGMAVMEIIESVPDDYQAPLRPRSVAQANPTAAAMELHGEL